MERPARTITYELPEGVAASADAPWASYPRQSSGLRPGAETSLLNATREARNGHEDMGSISERQEGLEGGDGDGGGAADGPRVVKPSGIDKAERNQREHLLNLLGRSAKASLIAANLVASSSHTADIISYDRQERILMLENSACPCCGMESSMNCIVPAVFDVHVCTRVGNYDLPVFTRQCYVCGRLWMPSAIAAGCFAAQAGELSRSGSRWFATDLLDYPSSELSFRGSSFIAVSEAFGSPDEPFFKAWMEYHRTVELASDLTTLGVKWIDKGPMQDCPKCADLECTLGGRPSLTQVGAAVLETWDKNFSRLKLRLSAMMDATQTLDQKSGAGSASDHIPGSLSMYLADSLQQQLEKDLFAARQASAQGASASDEGDGGCAPGENHWRLLLGPLFSGFQEIKGLIPDRHSEHCAPPRLCPPLPPSSGENYGAGRRKPTSGSKKKSEGLCGACCADGIPLRYLFFSMDDTHECFLFYDYIVDAIILRCKGVDFIFLDFGCKFGRHYAKRECADIDDAARARVKIAVPVMHAEGHVKPCRLRNCGIYIDGLGYVMGEEMEQLWYLSKFWAASTRSMTRANRLDFLNLALSWVAKRKASNMYKSLTKKVCRPHCLGQRRHTCSPPSNWHALIALIAPSLCSLSLCIQVRDMRAKETSYTSTLRSLENVRLAKGKEADLAGARAWMVAGCVRLTTLELGGGGDAGRTPADFLPNYALDIVKESLTRNTVGSDYGRSYDFFFSAKGRGGQRTTKRIKELTASLAVTETTHDVQLMRLNWLSSSGARQDLATLLGLPSFLQELGVAKRNEVSGLRTSVAVSVCELSALDLLISQRGQRSPDNAPNKKNARARTGFLNKITEHLHSLSKWEAWTATSTGVGLDATPARPSADVITAVRNEDYPWVHEAAGAGDPFDGMRAMLDTYRVISAKLARVLKELVDLPIMFERVYLFYKNLRLRISQCSAEKEASLAVIKSDIVGIKRVLEGAQHLPACAGLGHPCVEGCAVGEALQARGKKLFEARKLLGEIEMLRSRLEQAAQDAAPFDARAVGAGWELGPDDQLGPDDEPEDDYEDEPPQDEDDLAGDSE